MTGPIRDVRYVFRALGRSPGYTLTCVAVLALAIGVNAAIFSFVYSVILRPLPYTDPERLVFVWQHFPNMPDPPGARIWVSRRNYQAWRDQNTVFSAMAAFREMKLPEAGGRGEVSTGFAAANLFPMLGVRTAAGRLFTTDEERPGNDRVAVLTDAFFERRFQRDPGALGKTITLGGAAYAIVGVLPRRFHLPATWEGGDQLAPDLWVPLSRLWNTPKDHDQLQLLVAARLKPGVSLSQARTEMAGVARRLEQSHPDTNGGWTASVFSFSVEDSSPTVNRALLVLLAAVGFLLLIACANLANLTLARATLRSREVAVRLAVGATRARVIALLLTESLAVSVAGAAAGLLVAHWSIRLILALKPPEIHRVELVEINLPVLGFAALAAILTAALFGLAPALAASRSNLHAALKTGGAWGASAQRVRSRQLLIAAEVALALVLAAGAGLMIRSLHETVATGIGFDTTRLITADIELPEKRYPDGAARSQYFRRLLERVRAVPGVAAAAVIDNLPLHSVSISNFYIAGRPEPPVNALPMADLGRASPGYFSAIGLRLQAGRFFEDADLAYTEKDGNAVVLVNQTFARQFFSGENPIGNRLLSPDKKTVSEIVGVVSDYRPLGVEKGTRPQIFWPYLKLAKGSLVVRTAAAPESFRAALERTVRSIDPEAPAAKVQTMDEYLDMWQRPREFLTMLLVVFAALALALAVMGIYGVISSLVAARVREIGIRMAVGASTAAVAGLVLRQSMVPVAIGLVAGLAGSLVLSRFMQALLFQVHPRDPLTLGTAVVAILLVSPAAVYIPVRRATRVDCTVALREE